MGSSSGFKSISKCRVYQNMNGANITDPGTNVSRHSNSTFSSDKVMFNFHKLLCIIIEWIIVYFPRYNVHSITTNLWCTVCHNTNKVWSSLHAVVCSSNFRPKAVVYCLPAVCYCGRRDFEFIPRLSCHDAASLTDTLTLPGGFVGLRGVKD